MYVVTRVSATSCNNDGTPSETLASSIHRMAQKQERVAGGRADGSRAHAQGGHVTRQKQKPLWPFPPRSAALDRLYMHTGHVPLWRRFVRLGPSEHWPEVRAAVSWPRGPSGRCPVKAASGGAAWAASAHQRCRKRGGGVDGAACPLGEEATWIGLMRSYVTCFPWESRGGGRGFL